MFGFRTLVLLIGVFGVACIGLCCESNAPKPQQPANKSLALGFSDVLPELEGKRVYGAGKDFWFELPQGWRVVPIPEHIFVDMKKAGKEEMLLRPLLSADAIPYIRISRLFGLKMKPERFLGDEKGAAKHILDQFFGGKWEKEILGTPVLDLRNKRFFFSCRMQPAPEHNLQAAAFFRENYTLLVLGAFSDDKHNFSDLPFRRVLATLRFAGAKSTSINHDDTGGPGK